MGVDFSATQVRMAKQAYPGIEFAEGDAEALPFSEAQFEIVLNAFGLPHFANPDKATGEAYRALKLGGRFAYPFAPTPLQGLRRYYEVVPAPLRRIGTFGLAVGAACAFSLGISGKVLTFHTKA